MSSGIPLNPAQQSAVDHIGSPAIVLAGAGSGKTRVITQRIARLIDQGYPARSIVAVTFTNKASEEMEERLHALVGGKRGRDVWISTFHALGAEIARKSARHVVSGGKFVVYDAADAIGVVKEILREMKVLDRRYDAAAILARISHAKSAMVTPDELPESGEYDEIARLVFPRYIATLKRLNALDFDDLIGVPLRLLREVDEVREEWQKRVRHLLVDEFQDTNRTQLLLVKALAGSSAEVFCVGDDDQAIYGWRGADVRNVIDFATHFPGARTLALEQNYRSCQQILDVANSVIVRAERAYPKTLFSDRKVGERPVLVECDTNESESKFVLETAKNAISRGMPRREIGVLYRSNLLSRALEEVFRLANVPYRLIGGTSLYERREVKDLTAYLRIALQSSDEIAFRRVVNYPTRGIGDATLERVERYARARGMTFFDAAQSAADISDLDERARHALGSFVAVVIAAREKLAQRIPLPQIARGIADAIELRADITQAGPSSEIVSRRLGNLEDLYRGLERAEAKTPDEAAQVVNRLSLRFADADEAEEDRVTLSTLHGAKGLEFKLVFLIGLDEGILPHSRTTTPKATDIAATIDASEERRLFYVGVTRAKDMLYLVRAKTRALKGAPRPTAPSRFLDDIPSASLERRTFAAQAPLAAADLAAQAKAAREAMMSALRKPRT